MYGSITPSAMDEQKWALDETIFEQETSIPFPFTDSDFHSTLALTEANERVENALASVDELKQLISFIDLTTLAGDDTRERVEKLADTALAPYPREPNVRCAAICVYPARIPDVIRRIQGAMPPPVTKVASCQLGIAAVAGGFPSGQYPLCSRLMEVQWVGAAGANEVDVVIDRAAALEGRWEVVYDELKQMKSLCGPEVCLKVILSVGDLVSDENIYKASWAAMLAGADFIKTSTGKEKVNATPRSAFIMCKAIQRYYERTGRRVGFKAAGGIQNARDAITYRLLVEEMLGKEWLAPSLFRIGASSLLHSILELLTASQ